MSRRMAKRMANRAGIAAASITGRADGGSEIALADGGRLAWMPLPYEAGADVQWSWGRYDAEGWPVALGEAEDGNWLIADLGRQLRAA